MTVSRDLDFAAARELLVRLGDLADHLVLVGGQAVNFWAERYRDAVPALAAAAPFTSKDVDFCGNRQDVDAIAARLGGDAHHAEPFDPGPNIGVVLAKDDTDKLIRIDILRVPFGLDAAEVRRLSVGLDEVFEDGRVAPLRVMHPVISMESRAYNTAFLPGYGQPEGVQQLRASVLCAHEFLREILRDGRVRDVLKLNERIFRFRRHQDAARLVLERHQVDLFEAVLDDAALPDAFRTIRLPQMRAELAASTRQP